MSDFQGYPESSPETPEDVQEVPQDLQEKVGALKQIINVHDMLMQGQFPGHFNVRVGEGVKFLESLHKQLLFEAKNHPRAHTIPELLK